MRNYVTNLASAFTWRMLAGGYSLPDMPLIEEGLGAKLRGFIYYAATVGF